MFSALLRNQLHVIKTHFVATGHICTYCLQNLNKIKLTFRPNIKGDDDKTVGGKPLIKWHYYLLKDEQPDEGRNIIQKENIEYEKGSNTFQKRFI